MGRGKGRGAFSHMLGFGDTPEGFTHTSFGERMASACCGMVFGVFMFFGSLALIWYNEGRAVKTAATISEMETSYVTAGCKDDPSKFDGKLIWIGCDLDPTTFVDQKTAKGLPMGGKGLWISQEIEEYVWKEAKQQGACRKTTGGGKDCPKPTYSYSQIWSKSGAHAYENPDAPRNNYLNPPTNLCGSGSDFPGSRQYGSGTTPLIGKFKLTHTLLDRFSKTIPAPKTSVVVPNIPDPNTWNDRTGQGQTVSSVDDQNTICRAAGECQTYPPNRGARTGDCKIGVKLGYTKKASVMGVAKSNGDIEKYTSKQYPDYSELFVSDSAESAQQMIDGAKSANKTITWLLRFVGFIICWWGLQMVTGPISLAPQAVPCIGDMISGMVGCILCVATCFIATFWCFLVFAIAWLRFRPLIGIPCLLISVGSLAAFVMWRKKKMEEKGLDGSHQRFNDQPSYQPPSQGGYQNGTSQGYPPQQQGGYPPQQGYNQGGYNQGGNNQGGY
jgi:hypothetical protein